jgi:hypothetical protein
MNLARINIVVLATSSFVAGVFVLDATDKFARGNAAAWFDVALITVNLVAAVLLGRNLFRLFG